MPNGTVQAIGRSQSGKPQVTVSGQKYSTGQTDISNLQVGDEIEFESNSSNYNGRTVWFLNAWKLTKAAIKYAVPQPDPGQIPAGTTSPALTGAISEAELRFISNCVGNAIASGTVKDPLEIEKWFAAARNALRNQIG